MAPTNSEIEPEERVAKLKEELAQLRAENEEKSDLQEELNISNEALIKSQKFNDILQTQLTAMRGTSAQDLKLRDKTIAQLGLDIKELEQKNANNVSGLTGLLIFLREIKERAESTQTSCSLLEAARILRLIMVVQECGKNRPRDDQLPIPKFVDSRFKDLASLKTSMCTLEMPTFLMEACKEEITGRTTEDPWYVQVKGPDGIVQAVIVAEGGESKTWMRRPPSDISREKNEEWMITNMIVQIRELDLVEQSCSLVWVNKETGTEYALRCSNSPAFAKYLLEFDWDDIVRERRRQLDDMSAKDEEVPTTEGDTDGCDQG